MKPQLIFPLLSLAVALCLGDESTNAPTDTGDMKASASEVRSAASSVKDGGPSENDSRVLSGRLPRYYSAIVSPQQRVEIYAIQQSYREQIDELNSQLAALKLAEKKEIESVLDEQQLEQVKTLANKATSQKRSMPNPNS